MEVEKGKTAKYLREKRGVSSDVKDNLKNFNQIKKSILAALKDEDLTVPQLAEKLQMPAHEVMYYLMSLLKFGLVQTGEIDDDDAYFYYKLKA
jgi:predicted transcriptional regulator